MARGLSVLAFALAIAACDGMGPASGPRLSGQWVFRQLLISGPEDECGASGYVVFSQTGSSPSGAVALNAGACGPLPTTGALLGLAVIGDSISYSFGLCQYAGTLQGAGPDSASGTFSCSTLSGTGTWSAGRLGPPAALIWTGGPAHQRIVVGGSVRLSAVVTDAAGHTLPSVAVAWASTDPSVLTVLGPDFAGNVAATGVGLGSATVTATSSGFSHSVGIAVAQVRFASLSAGWTGTCGLTAAGDAWCWGGMPLGDSTFGSSTPAGASGGLAFASLSVGGGGGGYVCGVVTGGTAYCWVERPTAVPGALTFASVSVGGSHSCGLTSGGAAYCWGYNLNGELGNGRSDASYHAAPELVVGGLKFASVSAGAVHTCALTAAGMAYCWGYNAQSGLLGNGTTVNSSSPVAVSGGLTFTAITAGGDHTCGLGTNGAAWCWGRNPYGELGTGSTTGPDQCATAFLDPCSAVPVAVSGGLAFVALSAGEQHTCGIVTGGQVRCWGYNIFGQLGTGSTANDSTPTAITGGLTFQSISASLGNTGHTCGLTIGGVAYCWGDNYSGELGDGLTVGGATPVRVLGQP